MNSLPSLREFRNVADGIESFEDGGDVIIRNVIDRTGDMRTSTIKKVGDTSGADLSSEYDLSWLRSKVWPAHSSIRGEVRVVDLFSGCGALSLGVWEACRALELEFRSLLAVENDSARAEVYGLNFPGAICAEGSIEALIDGDLGAPPTRKESELSEQIGRVDILMGGPPCQGHSDLNNFTRRADPRNTLVLRLIRAVEILQPTHVIIENVQGIQHDRAGNVEIATQQLDRLGYTVSRGLVDCGDIGVPQKRRRFFIVASRTAAPSIELQKLLGTSKIRPVAWCCEDLLDIESVAPFDTAAVHSAVNQGRIEYLFSNGLYDLPNEMRPDCHRLKEHAYNAVYGRMHWKKPAPTITTGFGSTGQGRFVHPLRPRTITPHEAARIQFLPDFFSFGKSARTQLQKMIGNAVPSKAGYGLALGLLR